ncbi:hypothetical protein [Bradyrhizobium sp. RDT46]|uniref:hypothetical protein n=1 Tax=Bradyrhizobium sp. RDT46 TaxID=3341829 RepID=UPI0035C6B418
MDRHFLMDRHRWTTAALHHFAAWEREEREIFARMVPCVTGEGIALAGGYYRVARHFPKDRRQALIGMIESVAPVEGAAERRFDGFVRSVRSLANGVATAPAEGDRALRPLSGMSKFLWYRFPLHGFIYDSRVLAAVCRNGLTVRFDAMIDDFGGRPSDSGEWNFLIAAASYRTFAFPLHKPLAEVFEGFGLQAERAVRLIDTLFWLEGGASGPKREPTDEAVCRLAHEVGIEAFRRCEETMADLLRRA